MFEARGAGSGEALKESGSNVITLNKNPHTREDTLCAMFAGDRANLFGFSHFKFRTLLLVGKLLSQ